MSTILFLSHLLGFACAGSALLVFSLLAVGLLWVRYLAEGGQP